MCVRLCRLRHCGGHDGQCQCEGERDCCCVHCVGSKEINGCAHGRHRPRACVVQGATPPCRWDGGGPPTRLPRSEEHTSELQSLMRISYAVFCLKKKQKKTK